MAGLDPARAGRKRGHVLVWWVCAVLACLMLFTVGASAQSAQAGSPAPAVSAGVAEGAAREAPSDAPRLSGSKLRMPDPPEAYNTHDAGWIRFAYPPSERRHVQKLIAEADAARADLHRRLGRAVLSDVRVYVARTPGEMATLAPEGAPFPKYASGVAYSEIGLILLTIAPIYPNSVHDLTEVFRHELAHVALYDATDGHPVPRWFNEGFAVYASGEGSMVRLRTLWTATVSDNLLPLDQLERTFPAEAVTASVAYAQAADIVRFMVRKQDSDRFSAMVSRMRKGQTFKQALRDAYGTDLMSLEYEWREDVKRRYTYWPAIFSGGVVWVGMVGLLVWVWRRRRRRSQATLDRWAREEAAADSLRRQLELTDNNRRVHIVVARPAPTSPANLEAAFPEPDVPKVEHKGEWHTLH